MERRGNLSLVSNDLMGSLLLLLGIPFLLTFSFLLFPKVLRSLSGLSSNKREDANRRRELLRLLVVSELVDSSLLHSDSDGKGASADYDQQENDNNATTDDNRER